MKSSRNVASQCSHSDILNIKNVETISCRNKASNTDKKAKIVTSSPYAVIDKKNSGGKKVDIFDEELSFDPRESFGLIRRSRSAQDDPFGTLR